MFVRISLVYIWQGEHTYDVLVGPFDTRVSAETWRQGFEEFISLHKLVGEVMVVREADAQKSRFSPETPDEIYEQMYKSLYGLCTGRFPQSTPASPPS